MDLRTLTPSIRRIGGIYTFETAGEDMPKQPPAIINPREIKKATRARGEESAIPQVEIYVDDQGMAGQEEAPERRVTKAMREAKKRVGSRKEVAAVEKEILEQQVAKKVSKEKVEKEIVGGIEKKIVTDMLEDKGKIKKDIAELKLKKAEAKAKETGLIESSKKEVAEMKLKKAEAKAKKGIAEAEAKKAVAEAFTESIRAQTYLQYANERARELQNDRGIKWKEAKEIATMEWKEEHKPKIAALLTDVESDKTKKVKKPTATVFESDTKSNSSTPTAKKETAKTKAKIEKEMKKAEEIKLKASEPAKEKRKKEYTQQTIVGFVEALSEDELKNEYRSIHPRKAFPSKTVMKNTLIKSLGGRLRGKYEFVTSEDE
jgi:hypothetical protein